MLSVTINVLSSHYPSLSVTPSDHCSVNEVFVGLIMQYHYVGLDKMPVQPAQPEPSNTDTDNELDDTIIEEGDEHRRQISGAPQASMMCVENPDSSQRNHLCSTS